MRNRPNTSFAQRMDRRGAIHTLQVLIGLLSIGHCQVLGGTVEPLTEEPKPSRFSMRFDGGMAYTMPTDVTEAAPPLEGVELDFDTGFRFDIAGDYELTDWFRVEVEAGWIFNQMDSGTSSVDVNGSISQVPFYANILFQYPGLDRWQVVAGGGAGGALMAMDLDELSTGTVEMDGADATVVFAYQALAGVGYRLTGASTLGLMYRYSGTGDPTWDSGDTLGLEGLSTHSGTLTFSIRF